MLTLSASLLTLRYDTKAFFLSLCLRAHQVPEEGNFLPQKHLRFIIIGAFTPEQRGGRGLFSKQRFRPRRKEEREGGGEGKKRRKGQTNGHLDLTGCNTLQVPAII